MRTLMIALLFVSFATVSSQAQVKFGLKAGMSTIDIEPNQINIFNSSTNQNLGLSLSEAKYGFHFGMFTTIKMGGFFIQPEVLLNSSRVEYRVDDLSFGEVTSGFFNESYTTLDIPVMVGFKLGPLRLNGGPVGHVHLNSTSDLLDLDGYSQKFDGTTYGWQAGMGLDIGKIRIDARYEGNFNKYGDHISFAGNDFSFDDRPGRFLASIGFVF